MSTYIRLASQVARLSRVSQAARAHPVLRSKVGPRGIPRGVAIVQGTRIRRFYSTENSTPDGPDGKAHEAKPRRPPLPSGWVHLTETELSQLDRIKAMLPESQREQFTNLFMTGIAVTGVPVDMRDLLFKMQEEGHLTLLEKGRLMRVTFKVVQRLSDDDVGAYLLKTEGHKQPSDQNRPSSDTENQASNSKYEEKSTEELGTRDAENETKNSPRQDQQHPRQQQGHKDSAGQEGHNSRKNQKRPTGNSSGGDGDKKPQLSDALQSAVAILLTLWLWDSWFGGTSYKDTTWQELRRDYLEKGYVQKLVVINGERVRVELHPDAPKPPNGATLVFSIGNVQSFEHHLEQAQNELGIPIAERIPVAYESGSSTLTNLLLTFGPTMLFIGLILWTQRSIGGGRAGGSGMFNFGKSRAKKFNAESAVKVKFADVAGLEEAKVEIMEFVSFLKQPEKFERLGAKIPRGAILSGPPGTGKTLLAKATAGESGVPFFSVSGSEFVEMFVGVGPSRVRDLFAEGRKNAPCIIFIDEIDAIGRARQDSGKGFGGNDEREATLNQILTEMDGFNTREQVVVLAGTNRADVLDKALMRPGRFDRHIYIDRPTMKGRQEIFQVYLKKIVTNEDQEHLIGRLATLTPGFSGADISNVVNEAALIAARANADEVKMEHFERAIERVVGGLERKSLVLRPEEKKTVAYHEAGHAICGWYLEYADPLLKVSIIPRGQGALGYAQYLPQDAYLLNTNQLMDRMAMTMGGRVSEELHFPTVTTGASDDFRKVSSMARNMVTQWGMSEKVGPVHFDSDPNRMTKPFAEATAQQIDQEVQRIVEEAYSRCRSLLEEKRKEVGLIAEELLKKEVLVRDDMVRILGARPFGDNEEFEKYFSGQKSAPPPPPSETNYPPEPLTPSPAFRQLGNEKDETR